MNYKVVSITSQGQISIPARMRKQLSLDEVRKATVSVEGKKIIVEPIPDLLSLRGSLHHKAIKNKSIDEIIKLEKEAVGNAIAENYRRKAKKMGVPIPK